MAAAGDAEETGAPPAAYYARPGGRLGDWWTVLHPPYTAWHLSYVALGAALAPTLDLLRLLATLLAFLLAVGVAAHALDELQGRPLRTAIPDRHLQVAAAVALLGAVALGIAGLGRVGGGLGAFVVVGTVLVLGYNLELLGGALHTDAWFAASWGAFPVLTAYYAQAERLDLVAVIAAAAAFALTDAQRALSTPARRLRRRVRAFEATIELADGTREQAGPEVLLAPVERALRALSWGLVALAVAAVLARLTATGA